MSCSSMLRDVPGMINWIGPPGLSRRMPVCVRACVCVCVCVCVCACVKGRMYVCLYKCHCYASLYFFCGTDSLWDLGGWQHRLGATDRSLGVTCIDLSKYPYRTNTRLLAICMHVCCVCVCIVGYLCKTYTHDRERWRERSGERLRETMRERLRESAKPSSSWIRFWARRKR